MSMVTSHIKQILPVIQAEMHCHCASSVPNDYLHLGAASLVITAMTDERPVAMEHPR